MKVLEYLREDSASFPSASIKNVKIQDIGPLMQEYAEKERLKSQPQRLLFFIFELTNGTIITRLPSFYSVLGLLGTKIYRFVDYARVKCFDNFVESAVNACCQGDEIPNSGVNAETVKLLKSSSYGYQIMDRSLPSVTKNQNEEKKTCCDQKKVFKRLYYIDDQFFELRLVKSGIEQKEPTIVCFFGLQYAKLTILELDYNFSTKVSDIDKFEKMELDSLFFALAEKKLYDCIRGEKKQKWELLGSINCNDSFSAKSWSIFFYDRVALGTRKSDKRELEMFKREFR